MRLLKNDQNTKFHLYTLKVAANVKLAMQCFENFGGAYAPNAPLVVRLSTVQRQELMLPDSSTNSKIQCSLNNCQSRFIKCSNPSTEDCVFQILPQQICLCYWQCLFHIDVHASCSVVVFVMRLYSLFCVMVLLCSFDHINFRKLPFSTAVGHHES